jgi:GntR family transcriptional regulator
MSAMFDPRNLTLDAASSTPLYIQLADLIRGAIRSGALKVGSAIPSERDIGERGGISRVTVRKAIETLLKEGLLSRRHGSGTYVAPRIEQPAGRLGGFSAEMVGRGLVPGSVLLQADEGLATPQEAMVLSLALDATVVRLKRVRLANGEPLAIEHAIVPAQFVGDAGAVGASLYAALGARGHKPVRGVQRLQASLATSEEARLLSIPPHAAVLRIERRTFLADGRPVEFTRSAYRGDRYDFITQVVDIAGGPGTA